MRRLVAPVAFGVVLVLLIDHQRASMVQSHQQTPVFTAGVDVAEVDVSVYDKAHHPVRGLTAEDFTVFEDGKPQAIVAFTPVEIPEPPAPSAAWMRDVTPDVESNTLGEHRLFVIILDDALTGGLWVQDQMRKVAHRFIDDLGPSDEAAVIFSGEGWSGQSFTSDHSKLLKAVDTLRPTMAEGELCAPVYGSSGALRAAAEALVEVPRRRKTIVYISTGKALNLFPGIASRGCEVRVQADAEAAVRAAQLGNTNIYGIDPTGLHVKSGSPVTTKTDVADLPRPFLEDLATHTGGGVVYNTNDPAARVPDILESTRSYYLLGYQLTKRPLEGVFHRLEVKVNRADLEVRSRSSRFEPRTEHAAPVATIVPPVEGAIAGFLPSTGLHIEVTTAAFATAGENGLTEIALGVRLPASVTKAARDRVDVLVRAFTIDGRPMASVHENVPVVLEPDGTSAGTETAPELHFETTSRIDLKPGRYTLRIGVYSTLADKAGSVYTDVVVPDFANSRLALSGVVMTSSVGSSLRGDALTTLLPTTTRAFARDDRMQAFLRVCQNRSSSPSPVTMRTRIVDEHGAAVVDRSDKMPATAFARERQADYTVRLPLSTLAPGAYWMSISAKAGSLSDQRDVRFAVK